MKTNISLEKAREMLVNQVVPEREESIPVPSALGRILATDIVAGEYIPHFQRSPLDGYAVCARDTVLAEKHHPIILKVIEEVPAGFVAQNRVTHGNAVKVMTGAPIPEGADAVIKFEEVAVSGNELRIFTPLKSKQNIVPIGEDVSRGDLVAKKGEMITPALIGMLIALGITQVSVFSPPRIALISTGDELVDLGEPLQPGKIRNSNLFALDAWCRELGTLPILLGNVKDKKEQVIEAVNRGLSEADLVITTGGVSVGDYDVVKDALDALGAEMIFWKVAMKPGTPTVAAVKDGKLIIGLSGNPAAALISFDLLVIPVLKRLTGYRKFCPVKIEAVLVDGFGKSSPQRRFLRGRLFIEDGIAKVQLTGTQSSGVLKSMLGCNVLVDVAAGSGSLKAGEKVFVFISGRVDLNA